MTIEQALEIGLTHHRAGRLHDAELVYRQILAQVPAHGESLHLLGLIAQQVGQLGESEKLIRRAIEVQPNAAAFHSNLGEVLRMLGKHEEAIEQARIATELSPNDSVVWFNYGVTCFPLKRIEEAERAFKKSVELNPNFSPAWNNLGSCYEYLKRVPEAVASYEKALQLEPNDAGINQNLGISYCGQGKTEKGIAQYRKALSIEPRPDRHSHLLYTLLHHPSTKMSAIFAEHLEWAKRYAEPITAKFSTPHVNDRNPDRRLRVGYVTPNFRRHAVAFFSEPMIEAHDHTQFEIFCYSDSVAPDDVTERFKTYADHWREIRELDDAKFAQLVREDKIDILVDLTGHIPLNRLLAFARRPAPIQVTYLGYQATTGMSAMDYRLTDSFADPGGTERFYTEKLFRLPLFFVYRALDDSPEVNESPVLKNGFITFASMNTFVKVNDDVLATWAELLKRVPNARLMLLIPGGEKGNEHVRERFESHGIDMSRLELVPTTGNREYLELYHRIDIALDPFPFGGHTTTCDALWMGVPTIVLAGEDYVSRMGVSVMNAVGHKEWLASSRDEYIEKLVDLASDVEALSRIRQELRKQLQASPAMDAPRFTRSLEDAYRQMCKLSS